MNQHQYGMDSAKAASRQSTCLRRKYGSAIMNKNRRIISSGYNGAPSGQEHCTDKQWCLRDELNVDHGSDYFNCVSNHSEANAVINSPSDTNGCILYLYGEDAKTGIMLTAPTPCFLCTKMLLNAGITTVIVMTRQDNYIELDVNKLYDHYIKELFTKDNNTTPTP